MITLVPDQPVGARRNPTSPLTTRQTFTVNAEHGFHARPCAMLVKALLPFRSRVEVELNGNGQPVSGKSILGLMSLAAEPGSKLSFTIVGDDAMQAMTVVAYLFLNHFDATRISKEPAGAPPVLCKQ
ncbi:MAG TPA: HPr family phosphocarrier protein [Clostridia bacterium]|nr:HPr family phosphocarrier protein [Clostridia bacterium]